MLKTLTLRRFRGFESYELTDLTRVNLIVGKNNSGKTSILEAVELLVAGGHVSAFYGAAERRGGTVPNLRRDPGPAISDLFYGHECQPGASLELSSDDAQLTLKVRVRSLDAVEDVSRATGWHYDEEHPEPAFALSIVSSRTGNGFLFPITEDGMIVDYRSIQRQTSPFEKSIHFLTVSSFSFEGMARSWEDTVTHGQESEIVQDMELLLPDIDSIHFLGGNRKNGGKILVGSRGAGRRFPIGSFGDGLRRLLAFRLALAGAKNGFLLIDEIDSGLHWTVMEDVWRLLVKVAERLNVQVFATTHSYDCIRGLGTLLRAHPELAGQVSIHKLDQSLPRAVSLQGTRIPAAVEQELEVR